MEPSASQREDLVANFVRKLWYIVNDPDTDPLISWSEEGDSIVIFDVAQFSCYLLPRYYKHNNYASFIRQLNKHGFYKKVDQCANSRIEFIHPDFNRAKPETLGNIKRKKTVKAGSTDQPDHAVTNEIVRLVTNQDLAELEITCMKQQMATLEQKFFLASRQNEKLKRILKKVIGVVKQQGRMLQALAHPSQNSFENEISSESPSMIVDSSSDEDEDSANEFRSLEERTIAENEPNCAACDDSSTYDSDSDALRVSDDEHPIEYLSKPSGLTQVQQETNENPLPPKRKDVLRRSPIKVQFASPTSRKRDADECTDGGTLTKLPRTRYLLLAKESRLGHITSELVLSRSSIPACRPEGGGVEASHGLEMTLNRQF